VTPASSRRRIRDEAPLESGEGNEDHPTGTETILLVDDDASVRKPTARILRQLGYRVAEAGSGAAALDILDSTTEEIHLLLTDVQMPKMSGDELARRAVVRNPTMRVLYTSGNPANVRLLRARSCPCSHFLPKPFGVAELANIIRLALAPR
jgi:CheY-like chemotaxis protein